MQTYYDLLDVPAHASRQEIRQAYLQKCKEFHPDLHDGADWAHERLQAVNEAYHTLSDAFSRQQYDAQLLASTAVVSDLDAEPVEDSSPAAPPPVKTSRHTIRWIALGAAALLWAAVFLIRSYEPTPKPEQLQQQAVSDEQLRFQQCCERHPKLIRKSEYFLVMNTAPPIGFTFELERLLAKGDTTALRQKIAQLQVAL